MRETRTRSIRFLKDRRTVIASADRVFIAAITHLFDGIGPLVGAATSEQDALNCLAANNVQLLVCTDLLNSGSGPALVAAAKAQNPQLRCLMLIQTGTMGAEKVLTLANRFLNAKQVSKKQRRTVNNRPGFEDLMKRYINEQGGL